MVQTMLADGAYDANSIRALVNGSARVSPFHRSEIAKSDLLQPVYLSRRNLVERYFDKIKHLSPHSHPLRQARGQLSCLL